MQPEFNEDFRDILDCLLDHAAEFIVVGGWAVAWHGHPRATQDFDILVRPTPENAHLVMAALTAFGAPVTSHGVDEADLATLGTVYQLGLPPRRIDLLTEISGVSFDQAWRGREQHPLGSRTVSFLGRQELLTNKRASGRAKDLADVERLEVDRDDE